MQLNRFLLRETVHDEELVQRIVERICASHATRKGPFTHLKRSRAKLRVYQEPFVRPFSKVWGAEVELKSVIPFVQSPYRTRIESMPSSIGKNLGNPLNLDFDIPSFVSIPERMQGGTEGYIGATFTGNSNRYSTD